MCQVLIRKCSEANEFDSASHSHENKTLPNKYSKSFFFTLSDELVIINQALALIKLTAIGGDRSVRPLIVIGLETIVAAQPKHKPSLIVLSYFPSKLERTGRRLLDQSPRDKNVIAANRLSVESINS